MRVNRDVQVNSFQKGLSIDPSDMVLENNAMRYAQNVRIVNSQSASFVATNLQGTDTSFSVSSGYEPVAMQEFSGVLYIVSWNSSNGNVEVGSFPSPSYGNVGGLNVDVTPVYRPFNNYNSSSFTGVTQFGTTTERPVIQKLEIQPDFDESVNLCFTIKGQKPRIVNSNFIARLSGNVNVNGGITFLAAPARGTLSASNIYTTASLEKETSIVLYSTKALGISYDSGNTTGPIEEGGKLKPGNYQYVFYYLSEDFNRTNVVGQSSICQVFFGNNINNIYGGDQTQQTTKRVRLQLSNVDTDFRYIKVYFLYSSGQDGLEQQYLEMIQPFEITGTSIEIVHTGYEELNEVSQDEVNIDYSAINSASASTQVAGYYFLADIKQRDINYTTLRTASYAIQPTLQNYSVPITGSLPGYCNPKNTYSYLGYMGGETYPFGIVFIMKDGTTSPVFPIADNNKTTINATSTAKGLVTFKDSYASASDTPYDPTMSNLNVRHIQIDFTNLLANTNVINETVGCFIVRGQRRPNALTQGLLVPTIKAPAVEAVGIAGDGYESLTRYYSDNSTSIYNLNIFKHLINFDSIIEAYFAEQDPYDKVVVDENGAVNSQVIAITNNESVGYMPVSMRRNSTVWGTTGNIFSSELVSGNPVLKHWALISGEALLNEPEYVTTLERDAMGLRQLMTVRFEVMGDSLVTPYSQFVGNQTAGSSLNYRAFASHYNMTQYELSTNTSIQSVEKTVYVPSETTATGNDFVSKIKCALRTDSSVTNEFWVNQNYNSYFGVKVASELLYRGNSGASNPIGPRYTNYSNGFLVGGGLSLPTGYDCVSGFANYRMLSSTPTYAEAGFIVNIYPTGTPLTPNDLYSSIDNVTYRQISNRFTWDDLSITPIQTIFGGDCFTSRVSRKFSQTPERNPAYFNPIAKLRNNIDSGITATWWQESKYNLHLRQPKLFDVGEIEDRSFFPYKSQGNILNYRKIRLPETLAHSPGYSEVLPLKSFFSVSPLLPGETTRYLNRVAHSEKHIPNAFRNGYRSFLQNNFRDYDSSMGAIVGLFNHRGNLLVVFQHGIGIGGIQQRIETGRDGAGAVFIEPTSVLPPVLQYFSKEIGCQDHRSLVQTPGGVYGVDREKDKIWVVQDNLRVISDEAYIANWMIRNKAVNPRSGYDFENNEVLFTTDNWTLCFSEGLKRFTSFYTFNNVSIYGRRNREMFSFISSAKNQAHRHNSDITYQLYGSTEDVVIEYVVNKAVGMAKVIDYLNITSNEIPPSKIEVYSYNQFNEVEQTITLNSDINQYVEVLNQLDPIRDEENFLYRDKKYVARIPERSYYSVGSAEDEWSTDGRVRDKLVIVRITYNTTNPLELASILTYFRYSKS